MMTRRIRSTVGLAALVAMALAAPAANAATAAGPACPEQVFSQVFAPWGDSALYTLAPGGDFESGAAGWTLGGGAAVVPGSSPFAQGATSLALPASASALSPPICVAKNYPSWRFAVASGGGRLTAEVLYPKKTKDSAVINPASGWNLSPILKFATGQFNGGVEIRVRFTAAAGPVQVDDVYIDPRIRR